MNAGDSELTPTVTPVRGLKRVRPKIAAVSSLRPEARICVPTRNSPTLSVPKGVAAAGILAAIDLGDEVYPVIDRTIPATP